MPYGLYLSAAGAQAQSERLKVLAHNLANVATAGFKRELAILQARHTEAVEQGQDVPGSRTINDLSGGVTMAETVTDFSRGTLRKTGVPTDLAIDGDGFFVVRHEDQTLLTRAGNFQFANDGRLITQQGFEVLSAGNEPIRLDPRLPWRLREDGIFEQSGTYIPLSVVKPRSMGDLARKGENLFAPLADVPQVPAGQRRVVNGFLEQSTVSPTLEMMDLIETTRAYEANIRMIQNQDELMGALINRALRPA